MSGKCVLVFMFSVVYYELMKFLVKFIFMGKFVIKADKSVMLSVYIIVTIYHLSCFVNK